LEREVVYWNCQGKGALQKGIFQIYQLHKGEVLRDNPPLGRGFFNARDWIKKCCILPEKEELKEGTKGRMRSFHREID